MRWCLPWWAEEQADEEAWRWQRETMEWQRRARASGRSTSGTPPQSASEAVAPRVRAPAVGGDLVLVKYEGAVEALFKIAAEETDGLAVVSCSASKEDGVHVWV